MKIISSAIETVRDVEQTLLVNGVRNISGNYALPVFYTTGSPENFRSIVIDWLPIDEPDVRRIEL